MTRTQAEALVALALGLRGSSLLFSKLAMQTLGPFTLCAVRFFISFAIVALIFHKRLRKTTRKEILHSALVGFLYFGCMAFELLGLRTTASSTTAFIENTAVVAIPVIAALLYRRRPQRMDMICALIAMAGVSLMTLKGSHIGFTTGELLVFTGAMSYALTVIAMDAVTTHDDAVIIGVVHLFFIGFFSLIAALIFEDFRMPASTTEWGAILYLAIVCSAIGFTLQPIAQKYTTAERTGLFGALNPIVAGVLGALFLSERFSIFGIFGAGLILFSIFLPAAISNGLLGTKKDPSAALPASADESEQSSIQ